MILDHLRALAYFNKAMNDKVYGAARQLPEATVEADQGAYFGSIFGTLNHLVVADTAWLKRFSAHPSIPAALQPLAEVPWPDWYDTRMAASLDALSARRHALDDIIIDWAHELQASDLDHPLQYQNTQGQPFCKPFGHLALHLFNHQIHHRGQATTLLSQQGIPIEGTGMLPFV